jgi:phosphoribosylcarboxyaminoimidazole (NCAIR) mutase
MTPATGGALVGILMGSKSDWETMATAAKALARSTGFYNVKTIQAAGLS